MSQSAVRSRQVFEWTYETSPSTAEPSSRRTRRVLMIDDDPVMRKLILEMLGNRYQVLTSSNGLELPRLMTEFVPNLVLLDVMMPWVDGLQICRTIKSNAAWRKVPVIFISGRKKPADVDTAIGQGADAYLTKPFSMVELLHHIQTLLGEPADELF
jgi:DNA-binding response OmpR family regulator